MAKVINLKSNEDITSVIERLWETGEEEVYLVAPKESAVLKNIIALKLLKREADRLGKEVILITKDALGREMAKRVGLASRVALPKKAQEEEEGEVFQEVPLKRFESMIEGEVKVRREGNAGPRHFGDIRPKGVTIERHSVEVEEEEKITLPVKEEDSEEGGSASIAESASEESLLADDFFAATHLEEDKEEDPDEKNEPEEPVGDSDESDEDDEEVFPIHGLANGTRAGLGEGRRIPVRESKSFFDRLLPLGLKKFGDALKIEEAEEGGEEKSFAVSFFSGKFLAFFASVAVLVAFLALYFILPKAEAMVTPKTEAVNQSMSITADKGVSKVDFTQNKISAQLIKLDKRQSQEFQATGQRQVNDKAGGTVTIYNEYSSSPQVLVEKTRLVSEGGQTFRLVKTITVPGANIQEGKIVGSSIDAQVVADQPGDGYNVGPGRFTIPGFQGTPKYTAFYGRSKAAMSGGASGLMKVVTQDDYNKAKDALWQSLQPALDSEFKNQLPRGLKTIDGAQKEEITGVESTVAAGSPGDKFTMTIKGTATVVLFDEKNIIEIIKQKLADKLNNNDLSLVTDQIDYQMSSVDYTRGQLVMKVNVSGKLVWNINIDSLKKEISGRSEAAIRGIFAKHSEVAEVKVSFWPFWVNSVPSNLDKVIIKVSE